MEKIVLVGYGGHAVSVADCIERRGDMQIIGYTDCTRKQSVYAYLGSDEVLEELFNKGIHCAVISVGYLGNGTIRQELYAMLKKIGFCLPIIADPSAVIASTAKIGEGSFIGKGAVINADATIGKMAIVNTKAVVEHNCVVGNFSHIAVSAVICGGATIGDELLIGANATILQNVQIGNNCIIAAGTVINKNISDNHIAIGNQTNLVKYPQ